MNEVKHFEFSGRQVRTIIFNNHLCFIGKDLRELFGPSSYYRGLRDLSSTEKFTAKIPTTSGSQNSVLVSESGLYKMLININPQQGTVKSGRPLEQAEKRYKFIHQFKDWVTEKIIPSYRQMKMQSPVVSDQSQSTKVPTTALQQIHLLLQGSVELDRKIDSVQKELFAVKNSQPINAGQSNYIGTQVSRKVYWFLKSHEDSLKVDRKTALHELFRDINNQIRSVTGSRTRTMIPVSKFENACRLIDEWQPTQATRIILLG